MKEKKTPAVARLPTPYQDFIHLSRYSRFNEDKGRRETWPETVARYFDFFDEHIKENHGKAALAWYRAERPALEEAVLKLEVMPSMRCLMTAGPALKRDHVAGYNCSYLPIESVRAFDELMYILLCGTGVGFSVERQYINKLPEVPDELHHTRTVIRVQDSKIGWATALRELLSALYSGLIPEWDLSAIRPRGSRLRTFGGRASGPEPLDSLFKYTIALFEGAKGRRLTSIEVHDLVCKIADVVVVGGVRRSALISLSNLTDERMRNAKNGNFYDQYPHRSLANNSVCYTERPDIGVFLREWHSLYDSKSGERGIFNRMACTRPPRQSLGGSSHTPPKWLRDDYGTNPCSEIVLRPFQFCNLTEAVIRSDDTTLDIDRKLRLAAKLGTIQSTLVDFRYLSKIWKNTTAEERLLGVSMTGICDNIMTTNLGPVLADHLEKWRETVVHENKSAADMLGIPHSAATTCVKPSGTVSQLVDCASGIHPRHSEYYIRRVRMTNTDPLCRAMKDAKFPNEPDLMSPETTTVFSFPMMAPEFAVTRGSMSALQHLELWKTYKHYWCEHKPSITVSVKEHEWIDVAAWVYHNWDDISGIAFLPYVDHVYQQPPYEDCDRQAYLELKDKMPDVDLHEILVSYEIEDNTSASQELACTGNVCEVV